MKAVAIIQARMGSTRLPGKVMRILSGKTVLAHVIRRVQSCPLIETVVIATTTSPSDDIIVAEAEKAGARTFRGSEEDVLSRYYHAAVEQRAKYVVRVTSDCPLIDATLLTAMLSRFFGLLESGAKIDYLSNAVTRTFPRGLDAEVFSFAALERAYNEGKQPHEREHVTPYIWGHPELFPQQQFTNDVDLSRYRWTVDTPEDFQLLSEIFNTLGDGRDSLFSTAAVLDLMAARPELPKLNAHIEQKKIVSG